MLSFDEPVTPLVFRWLGPDGAVREIAARSEGRRVLVPVPPVGRGSQLLSWRVASSDGHPVGGALSFAIGAPSATSVIAGPVAPTAAVAAAAQGLLTLLLVIGVGGAVFAAVLDPAARAPGWTRTLARAAAVAAVPAAALALLAHGCDLLGSFRPPAGPLFTDALASPFARTVALAALAGLLAASGRGRTAALAAWAAAALSFAVSGHAVTAPPRLADHRGDGAARRRPRLLARRPAADRRLGRLRPPRPCTRARPLLAAGAPPRRPAGAERRRPRHRPARPPLRPSSTPPTAVSSP